MKYGDMNYGSFFLGVAYLITLDNYELAWLLLKPLVVQNTQSNKSYVIGSFVCVRFTKTFIVHFLVLHIANIRPIQVCDQYNDISKYIYE